MRTVKIRVNKKTLKMLDATITELRKHKKGRILYDDALQHLLDEHDELQAELRALKAKERALEQAKDKLQGSG